jgi:hypothetical protein
MADDPFILFVKGIHRGLCERNPFP